MTRLKETTKQHGKAGTTGAQVHRTQRVVARARSFSWNLMAMGIGIVFFQLLVRFIQAPLSYATLFEPGSDLYNIGMAVFMTVPTWLVSQCAEISRNVRAKGC